MEKQKKIVDFVKINQMKCVAGIIMGSVMVILAFIALILNISNYFKIPDPEAGMGTFRMFTTLSNILVGGATLLSIPFQIDGLRKKNYYLPKWIVVIQYIGTAGVTLTFFIAITVISFAKGFTDTMFNRSNIFLHTINPICAMILFTFINCDHKIKFKESFFHLFLSRFMLLYI